MNIDLNAEAYEISSELFSFKDMRRGVIEHGRLCYIEGYKKHVELFSTFLLKNGYFSEEELHKVLAEFDGYLNGTPAVSILICEDILRKIKTIDFSKHLTDNSGLPEGSPDPIPYLSMCQKDIIMHYCDTLKDDKRVLRIKKARQKGVSTVLGIIAYLESQNEKNVLYFGCSDPRISLGLKYNQFFKYTYFLGINRLHGRRYDLIIVDDPRNCDFLSLYPDMVTCLTENGRIIVSLTPCSHKNSSYSKYKDFFKSESSGMFTYSTGPSDRAERLLELTPDMRNEIMGEFID